MKNPLKIITLFLISFLLLTAGNLFAAGFNDFMKDLRDTLFSAQGKGKVFGYTADHVFAEVKEGSFKPGDVVIVKGMPDIGVPVPLDLYEDAAYGEVEEIKDRVIKIYILKKFKAVPREAYVAGMKRLHVNLVSGDDISVLYQLFLREKDLNIQEKPDEKTNIKIFFNDRKDGSFSYRVVSSAGRILMVGSLTPQGESAKTLSSAAQKDDKGESSLPVIIAFNEKTGDQWILKGDTAVCHTCEESRSRKAAVKGGPINMFFENGNLVVWGGDGKTVVLGEKGEETGYDGYLTQDGRFLFDPIAKKIYDPKKERVIAGDIGNISLVYYFKDGRFLGRSGNKLAIMEGKNIINELPVKETDVIRLKGDKVYVFKEVREEVPLAGDYITLFLDVFEMKTLKPLRSVEMKEPLSAFDMDEKNGEIIYLKKDGTVKRIKI